MKNIYKIISFTKEFRWWYLGMGLAVVITSGLSLISPFLLKQIVDTIVGGLTGKTADANLIIRLLIIMIAVDLLSTVIIAITTWFGDMLAAKLQSHLTRIFYKHLLTLDVGFFDNEITGTIVNKMYRGIESITSFIQNMINNFLPFFLTAFVTIIILAQYSPVIAVLLAALFPAYIIISHKSSLVWHTFESEKNTIQDASQGRVFESFSGIRVVKAFAAELTELTSYITARKKIEGLTVTQSKGWHLYDFYRRIILNVILIAILSYIVYYTFRGVYTVGEMTLLIQLVNQARFPLFAMSFILGQIQQADAGSKDFFSLLTRPVGVKDVPNAKILSVGKPTKSIPMVEFSNVSFNYDTDKKVLNTISFSEYRGQKLALVGESGQGKSTIVNLLLRYYEPISGVIKVNGQDISRVTQESLRQNIAVVFQDSLLFSGSVTENIRYGKPNASQTEIHRAAKAANADEFITGLPDSYNSLIGERGVKLSGGQKQRIAIARALLKDAPIIVLDEATSSLDSRSEILVQQGLNRLMENRTSIIIAHRLSTIADADIVLVISRGTIAQCGSPKELLKNSRGPYAQMIHLQQKLLTATPEERMEALRKFDLVG